MIPAFLYDIPLSLDGINHFPGREVFIPSIRVSFNSNGQVFNCEKARVDLPLTEQIKYIKLGLRVPDKVIAKPIALEKGLADRINSLVGRNWSQNMKNPCIIYEIFYGKNSN
jgi:hypothetical protein